jgi:hypothetical protein
MRDRWLLGNHLLHVFQARPCHAWR